MCFFPRQYKIIAVLILGLSGFPPEFILPLSILSRTQGFMAHWREAMGMPETTLISFRSIGTDTIVGNPPRIWRPGQIYTGDLNKSMDE